MKKFNTTSLLLLLALLYPTMAFAQVKIPPNDGFFTSVVSVITPEESEKIELALSDIAKSTEQNIVVFFIDDLFGKEITTVASSVQEEWNLPENSILLLISYRDRTAFIQAGKDVSNINQESATGIVETDIIPHMRSGEYNLAIVEGVEAILLHISGDYTNDRYKDVAGVPTSLFVVLLYALVFLSGLSLLFGTIILFSTQYKYSIAGTLLGPIIGVILLEKYGLWLSIPPFVVVGMLTDVAVYKLYKSVLTTGKGKRSRRRR